LGGNSSHTFVICNYSPQSNNLFFLTNRFSGSL
jgi:hypothetical protein